MALKRSSKIWLGGGVAAAFAVAAVGWFQLHSGDNQLPHITPAGIAKLAYYDQQIAQVQGRADNRRTDVDYAIALATAQMERGKATADGRDFDHATAVLDETEIRIADHTRTEQGATQLPELFAIRARILAARHRFVEARQVAEKALRKYPADSDLMSIAGSAAVQAGDLAGGEALLRKLVNESPRVPNYWIALSYWAEISGDLEQAADLLTRAPDAAFPRPLPRLRLAYVHAVQGDIQSKLGKLAVAKQYYQEALKTEPTFASARSGLADVAQYEGQDAEAEALLRGLVDSEWPNADYQVKLAALRERLGDRDEAATLRKTAQRFYEWSVATGFDGYLRPLATLKLAQGEYKTAARYAARDLEIRPNAESRAIYRNIVAAAQAAGKSLPENLLDKQAAGAPVPAANSSAR